jgi:hypothetical protein
MHAYSVVKIERMLALVGASSPAGCCPYPARRLPDLFHYSKKWMVLVGNLRQAGSLPNFYNIGS